MINISNSLKQACNGDKLTYREYVVLKGTTAQIDVMTEMYATAYKDTHFIGSFNMKYIKFTTSNDVKYRNKELTLYKEINGESFKIGNFIVTEIKDDDSKEEVTVTAYDYALKFAQPYETNLDYSSGNVTLYQVLQEVCINCGVILKNQNITNGDFIVDSNQFVDRQLYGDVISAIAFVSGNFATINNDDNLELIFTKTTNEVIEDYVDLEDKRDTQPITSVSIGVSNIEGENVVLKDENLIAQYGEHWLIINDVPFAYTQEKRQQLITAIFNKVKGFGYSAFKSEYAFKPYMSLGDLIQFRNKEGNLVNSIVLRITSKYDNIILEAPSITKAIVAYQNPLSALEISKRTEIIVDKQNQTIQSVISQTNSQNQKIAEVTQTVEELNSKISDIADITTSVEDTDAKVELNEINQSEPIRIVVRPINEDITNFLISSNMLISENMKLKQRVLDFYNKTTDEHFTYTLPDDLLFYDSNNYDEFILDYDGQSCVVNKKVAYNVDGTKYLLDSMKTIAYEFPKIVLSEGDYVVSILDYNSGYIFARLMAKNIYTTQFYTKAEVDSEINQTAQNINLSVNSKLSNYSTTSEMNSAISLKANEITSSVSQTYSTKNETINAKNEAINSANSSTDTKLENYSTTVEMNNKISQEVTDTENRITSSVSANYTTKDETVVLNNIINQRITNEVNAINLEVSSKANTNDVNNALSQKANTSDVNASLELKIDKNDNNQVVSMINASANEISLKGNRLIVEADNFSLDKNGNMVCTNAKVTGEINSNTGDIGGWKINNSGLTNGAVFINSDGSSTIYTVADLIVIRGYIMGLEGFELPPQMIRHYDLNGDGVVNSLDYVRLQNLIGISMQQ